MQRSIQLDPVQGSRNPNGRHGCGCGPQLLANYAKVPFSNPNMPFLNSNMPFSKVPFLHNDISYQSCARGRILSIVFTTLHYLWIRLCHCWSSILKEKTVNYNQHSTGRGASYSYAVETRFGILSRDAARGPPPFER